MGTGKTFISTAISLFHKVTYGHQVVVIMPPILIRQWGRWLASIKPEISVTEYRGTPAQRDALDLDMDFVLVGVQIFKRDFARFQRYFSDKNYTVIIDEANLVGNIESDNHKKVYEFAAGHPQIVLTGTPMNSVMDAYGLLKFSAPGAYRSIRHFENTHVEERDFYKKPIKFGNLDLLAENMMVNSRRILLEDMYPDLDEPAYIPTYYDLAPAHYKLYRKLAEEELLKLPDGGKIDATSANKLIHALGQIIVNYPHFSGNPDDVSLTVEMITQKLSELGDGKLVVFANYKLTVAHLKDKLQKFGAVTINSEVTEAQKERNLQAFMTDPECRVVIAQFVSAGKGLDGLQHVCNHAFFAEPCQQPRDFHQAVARLKRLGQKKKVMVMMGIANNTTQVRGFKKLLDNDDLVNKVIRNATELREAIYGN
jgi:SNF2 family DNA or RNA helicase